MVGIDVAQMGDAVPLCPVLLYEILSHFVGTKIPGRVNHEEGNPTCDPMGQLSRRTGV